MGDRRLIIVVSAASWTAANVAATTVDAVGGDRAFTNALVPPGSPVGRAATFFWCDWRMTAAEEGALRTALTALVTAGQAFIFDGDSMPPGTVLQNRGLELRKLAADDAPRRGR